MMVVSISCMCLYYGSVHFLEGSILWSCLYYGGVHIISGRSPVKCFVAVGSKHRVPLPARRFPMKSNVE